MKRKPKSLIKKFVLRLFAALFCIIAVVFLVFGIKGYSMYRDAVTACPIPQMVSSIQSRENFVEYEELPTIYIDAVISVEDKRFESPVSYTHLDVYKRQVSGRLSECQTHSPVALSI